MTNARVMQVATSLNSALANYDKTSVIDNKIANHSVSPTFVWENTSIRRCGVKTFNINADLSKYSLFIIIAFIDADTEEHTALYSQKIFIPNILTVWDASLGFSGSYNGGRFYKIDTTNNTLYISEERYDSSNEYTLIPYRIYGII